MLRLLIAKSKNFSIITFCNVGVQIISLLFFAIIARAYEPEILGEYIIYLSYVSIVVIMCTGFYEQALFIDKKERRQSYIIAATIVVAIILSLLSLIPLYFIAPEYAIFLCFAVFGGALRVLSRSYAIVNGKLKNIAIFDLITSPIMPLLLVLGAKYFAQSTSTFLISVNAIMTLLIGATLYVYVIYLNNIRFIYSLKKGIFLSFLILKRYSNLPKYKMTSELVAVFSLRLPVLVMDKFFTANMAAFYGVAFRIAITPVTVITSTVAQMFLHKIRNNRINNESSFNVFIRYSLGLLVLALICVMTIFTISEWVIVQLFTDKYRFVAYILKLMSPYIAVLIAIIPLTSTFIVYEKQKYLLLIQLALLILTSVGYFFAVQFDNIDLGIIFSSISSFVVYGGAYYLMYKNYNNERNFMMKL